jgi:hypothetical protein
MHSAGAGALPAHKLIYLPNFDEEQPKSLYETGWHLTQRLAPVVEHAIVKWHECKTHGVLPSRTDRENDG